MSKSFEKNTFRRFLIVSLMTLLPACANLGPSEESGISLTDEDNEVIPLVTSQSKAGYAGFTMGSAKHQVKWLVCNHENPDGSAVIIQGELPDFQDAKACQDPITQSFLHLKLSVLLVSRPGSMGSTGQNDLGGPLTIAGTVTAIKTVVAQPQPELKGKIITMWGYGSGAGVASIVSKQIGGISTLILGGGFYDYEDVLINTKSAILKKAIGQIKSATGDKGIEFRSVSYDIAHLPPKILIYHGALDEVAPVAQARNFADSLRTSGDHQVTLKILEQTGHWLKPAQHQHAILLLFERTQNPEKSS
jgi:hypothetical protein